MIPIALFAYKRVEHLALTLDALKKNSVPLIYAFSDGPKSKDDINEVKSVRDLLRKIDWCKVIYFEEDHNLGLGKSIRKGISRVFEDFEKVIVIEDDIVMRPGAFKYTVDALNYYENHEEVMSVSMWADPFISQNCQKNGFFSERFVCWGWGTYKKYWKTYTGTPLDLFNKTIDLKINTLKWGKDIMYQAKAAEERNLWYVGYLLQHFLNKKISYFPKESLIANIGKDGSGENTVKMMIQDDKSIIELPVKQPALWPQPNVEKGIHKKFARFFEHRTEHPIRYFVRKIRNRMSKLKRK